MKARKAKKLKKVHCRDKKIVLGLSGGIAIYKSANLLRRLTADEGADVTVVMTDSAQQFMQPLVFETFSGRPVLTDMWTGGFVGARHIDLASESEAILVCPATANIVAKAAHGIADDLLSTIILAAGAKTIFALKMNVDMYENPITQANIHKLQELGYGFVPPEEGELACNSTGKGRLAPEPAILDYLDMRLNKAPKLTGKRVLVTAGPTWESIDAVRYISNRSSGKMGFALARAAAREASRVSLITGPSALESPFGVERIDVESAAEMDRALQDRGQDADLLLMAAAVEDIVPVQRQGKLKKSDLPEVLPIDRAPDIVSRFRHQFPKCRIVGFSVEIEDGKARSLAKMKDKGLDFIVWNDPSADGAGFAGDTNEVTVFSSGGDEWQIPKDSKAHIADEIINIVSTEEEAR